jgi:hypothetical protein
MSANYSDNQAQNIVIPANVVEAAIKALQEDRASQRAHEAALTAALIAFTASAADKVLTFAKEEAARRAAANTAEQIEALRNERAARSVRS